MKDIEYDQDMELLAKLDKAIETAEGEELDRIQMQIALIHSRNLLKLQREIDKSLAILS
jgi:hypothetical protein